MRALILCAGPSLRATLDATNPDNFHRVIVVNRARDAVRKHDWFVCGDAAARMPVWNPDERTSLGICSNGDVPRPWRMEWMPWADLPFRIMPNDYSSVAALALAWRLGCQEIAVAGHDMQGDSYFNGVEIGAQDPHRWGVEAARWAEIAETIFELGGEVRRLRQPLAGSPSQDPA